MLYVFLDFYWNSTTKNTVSTVNQIDITMK